MPWLSVDESGSDCSALVTKQNIWYLRKVGGFFFPPRGKGPLQRRHLSRHFCGDRRWRVLLIITFSAGSLFSSHYGGIMKRGARASLRFSDQLAISTRRGRSSRRLLLNFFFFLFVHVVYLIITERLHDNRWSVGRGRGSNFQF